MHLCGEKDRAVVLVSSLCMCVYVMLQPCTATMHRDSKHQTDNDVAHSHQDDQETVVTVVVLMVA